MKVTQDPHTNLYMLNLTQQEKLITDSTTPDEYFQDVPISASQRGCWWAITPHPDGDALSMDRGKQSQKTSSLLGQTYHLTWYAKMYPKKNKPYLGTFSNL